MKKLALLIMSLTCVLLLSSCNKMIFESNGDGTCSLKSSIGFLEKEIVIPSESPKGDTVTQISDNAFRYCKGFTSVTIPDSVTSIGDYAFLTCYDLTSVHITDLAKWCGISFDSFSSNPLHCAENLYLNGNLVTELTIPDGVSSISNDAFSYFRGFTSVTIPDSVLSIGYQAFCNCRGLTSVTIPDSVRTIEEEAFYYCNHLETIILPDSVTSMGKNAFSTTAYELNKKNWENNNALYIGNHLIRVTPKFNDTQITVKYGTRTIADYAFADYLSDGLTNDNNYVRAVTLPDTITHIGRFAFYSCSALDNIIIPDSVIYIGEDAFYKCTGLESMTIPFTGESRDATGYKSHFGYIFGINIKSTSSANEYHYKDAPYYFYTFNIPSGLREITFKGDILKTSVFRNCKNVTNFVLQKNLSNIGEKAFENCANVTNIIIPESVTSIDDSAFRNCTNLTNIIIGNNVTSIGNYVFTNCSKLTNVYYKGTAEDWSKITIGSDNSTLTNSTRYYYSETKPTAEGNYWYYNENGEIAVWENSNSTEE